jgi:hypothetical protein
MRLPQRSLTAPAVTRLPVYPHQPTSAKWTIYARLRRDSALQSIAVRFGSTAGTEKTVGSARKSNGC